MIHNSLFNPRFGRGLAPALVSTLTELRRCDLPELALGHHPIDGDNIFMDVMTLTTAPAAEKRAEMHQEYIALHLLYFRPYSTAFCDKNHQFNIQIILKKKRTF